MKTHIFYLILISTFISFMSKCKVEPTELEVIPLSLERTPYTGDELIIDGYYHYEWESDVIRFHGDAFMWVIATWLRRLV